VLSVVEGIVSEVRVVRFGDIFWMRGQTDFSPEATKRYGIETSEFRKMKISNIIVYL